MEHNIEHNSGQPTVHYDTSNEDTQTYVFDFEAFEADHNDSEAISRQTSEQKPAAVESVLKPITEVADTAIDKAKRLGSAAVSVVRIVFTGRYE